MQNSIPIYAGKKEAFHGVGFGSGSGTNLSECAKMIPPALVFSHKPDAGLLNQPQLAQSLGIEHKVIPSKEYAGRRVI
jgi:hypothetical protein